MLYSVNLVKNFFSVKKISSGFGAVIFIMPSLYPLNDFS